MISITKKYFINFQCQHNFLPSVRYNFLKYKWARGFINIIQLFPATLKFKDSATFVLNVYLGDKQIKLRQFLNLIYLNNKSLKQIPKDMILIPYFKILYFYPEKQYDLNSKIKTIRKE